jgi:hypothetical protein
MKYRKLGGLDWFIIVLTVLVILIIAYAMNGCSALRQSATTVSYTKGCHIEVKAVENEKAAQMMNEVRFDDCTVGSQEDVGNEPPPDEEPE